jgi:GT2 family glycosyltransferase
VKVIAVVPTFNRGAELSACFSGLASQTRPVDAAIVVDNASTEPIRPVLERGRHPFPVGYMRLSANAGSAGGFAAAVEAALEKGADWVWLQDSDGVADPACLEVLAGAVAREPDAAVLAPLVHDEAGGVQGQHRGRYVRGHTLPTRPSAYERDLVPIDYASNIGILVNAGKIADAGGPDPRLFIWIDDLEWCLRLGEHGALYLVPSAVITHNDGITGRSAGLWATLRTHLWPGPNAVLWRYIYAFRNSSWLRKERHGQGPLRWFANWLVQSARVLLVGPHRRRAPRLFWWYGMAGRHGVWGQIPDARWEECLGPGGDPRLLDPRDSPFIELVPGERPPVDWL